jgi:hypothetical protein
LPAQAANAANTTLQLTELTLQLRDAYKRNDLAVFDRIWGDEFAVIDPSGARRAKPDLLNAMKEHGSEFEFRSMSDIRVRDYGEFPVVTYRAVGFAKIGTNLVPMETFTSTQYWRSSIPEVATGLGPWRAMSAMNMLVHQAPPGYSPEAALPSDSQ